MAKCKCGHDKSKHWNGTGFCKALQKDVWYTCYCNHFKEDKRMFTDKIDVTTTISLFEYGLIRNPETGKVIFCINPSSKEHDKDNPPQIRTAYISLEDVKHVLEDVMEPGFYEFIGQDKAEALETLDNEQLAYWIMSINQYNGYFSEATTQWI